MFAYDHGGAFGGPSETDIPLHVFPSLDTASGARAHMVRCGCSDVAIFRVLDDGREERLPRYEEALAEIDRLREIEGANILNANALRLARENLSTTLDMAPNTSMYDLQNEARRRLGADPLAALEAAERRLLEAGGWRLNTLAAGFGVERWERGHDVESRTVALSIERRRLAAEGGA